MRLKHIKLAGFKSFVDPTTVPFPGNLAAIVGPNGCGKSNIIDAVRWVMGESSAKQLRGESLDDVIFNGSSARKPVGQAAIELTFDNSAGKLQGQYAAYGEIAVRRELTRDGQSTYFLNGTRCRRRDITDLFLGTGLGPRSYAIVEQGMISRVIDAKPDELRAYIEEASGVSKYKERRHETELRIKHTEENLARLNDIREELGKQLDHLQRQANAAERYNVLKQQERLLKAQIQALRYRAMNEQLTEQTHLMENHQSQLETATNTYQQLETELEKQRELHTTATSQTNDVQANYYQIGNDISRLTQSLQHQQEKQTQWQTEQRELAQTEQTIQQQCQEMEQYLANLTNEIASLKPQALAAQQTAEQSNQTLTDVEQALHKWQQQWEEFNHTTASIEQNIHVEQARIQQSEQHIQTVKQRLNRLEQEHKQHALEFDSLPADDLAQKQQDLQNQQATTEQSLQTVLRNITEQREQIKQLITTLDQRKQHLQALHGQQGSLEALQQAALGQNETNVVNWLTERQLVEKQRLAQLLRVEAGWEQAVETVLEKYLQAVCVDNLTTLDLNALPQGNLSLITTKNSSHSSNTSLTNSNTLSPLADKVTAPFALDALLAGIYTAENLSSALSIANSLAPHESIITRDGVWLGNGWLTTVHKADAKQGILRRERELNELKKSINEVSDNIQQQQNHLQTTQSQLHQLENERESIQRHHAELIAAQAELRAQQQVRAARLTQAQQRAQQIESEIHDCKQQIAQDEQSLHHAQQTKLAAQEQLQARNTERDNLLQAKTEQQTTLDNARHQAQTNRETAHQLALRVQAVEMQLTSTQQNQTRLREQLQQMQERKIALENLIAQNNEPLTEINQQLHTLNAEQTTIENKLNSLKQEAEKLQQRIQQLEKQRHQTEQTVGSARDELDRIRFTAQELQVRAKTLQEQIVESGFELATLLNELPADAMDAPWEEQLLQVVRKIERLGPINLAAIDEHQTCLERKNYLDAQNADLTEALTILQNAIQKIDQETRARFKETFDQANTNFQGLFPRLFGGGRASLELTEDGDLLTAGIALMAQPPGKRNSTIHLLSGGEKALTATALIFSLFQLNPAPFCMLDEVDAPLDDANVVRFCNLVKEMSNQVQFIFISHNKLAIEMASQLAGVTMHEAGVSRLVAVDVDEAIALATA